jgi:hypothetical protein
MARSLQGLLAKLLVAPQKEGVTSKVSYAAADQVQRREFGIEVNRQVSLFQNPCWRVLGTDGGGMLLRMSACACADTTCESVFVTWEAVMNRAELPEVEAVS